MPQRSLAKSPFIITLIGVLLVGFAPSALRAQDANSRTKAAARAFFEEGVSHADEGRWKEAEDRFRRALELHPASVVSYNLALVLMEQDRLLAASEILHQLKRDLPDADPVKANAAELLEVVSSELAQLQIELSGESRDVEVELDGQALPRAMIGAPFPVDPGEHRVAALRFGDELASAELKLSRRGQEKVLLELPQEQGGGRSPAADLLKNPYIWIAAGAIVTATVVGVVVAQ